MTLRIGFIGAGGIARRHLDVLAGFNDVAVTAVADPVLERAQDAAPSGARAYAEAEAMLEAEALDALWICVPPFAHGAPERAAIARALPFFVEKPLGVNSSVAEEIAASVAAAGLVTSVGYHWRWMDQTDVARTALAQRPARLVNGYWLDSTPPPRWWGRRNESGGQANEQTTHIFDLARYLVGEVEDVTAYAARTPREAWPEVDVDEASVATLRFRSGAVGTISSTCLLGWGHRVGLNLFGDDLVIELNQGEVGVYGAVGTTEAHAGLDPVAREDRAFLDAVAGAGGEPLRCTYADALGTQRLTDAVRRSAAIRAPVKLES